MPRFILASCTVAIWLPILKDLLMRFFTLNPLWVSYMLIQTIAMSDFRYALITHNFKASNKLLKMLLDLMAISTKFAEIEMLVFLIKKGMSVIFK